MEHVRKLYQLSSFEGPQLKYEVYTQPLHNWLFAKVAGVIMLSTVKPGIKQAVSLYERFELRRHNLSCNNDCGEVTEYKIPGDFDSGVSKRGCVFMPFDARIDCWYYDMDHKNSKTVRAI